jgi:CHAT domain-containing protein
MTGTTYCDLGNVYYSIENYELAIEYYKHAKNILVKSSNPNTSTLSIVINNLGSLYYRKGDYDKAIKYFKEALQIQRNLYNDYYNYSMYLNNIGGLYLILNKLDSATRYYNKSLEIRSKYLNRSSVLTQTYNQIAFLNIKKENYKMALSYIQKAINNNKIKTLKHADENEIDLSNAIDFWQLLESFNYKAIAFYKLSEQNKEIQDKYQDLSLKTFKKLLRYFDKIYANHLSEINYINYLAFNREVLNNAIDISYHTKNCSNEDFYSLIEKGKSILLFQSFVESEAKKIAGVPESLISLEKEYNNEIIQIDYKINSLENSGEIINSSNYYYKYILKRNNLVLRLDSLISWFENKYPEYYNLKYNFADFDLNKLQNLIPDSSAILEYFITDSMYYAVFISDSNFSYFGKENTVLKEEIKNHKYNINFFDDKEIEASGKKLFQLLLEPFEKQLQSKNTLIVIPDLELSLLPFESLTLERKSKITRPYYIIYDFNFLYHFSSTLYGRSLLNQRPNRKSEINLFACAPITNKIESRYNRYKSLPYSQIEVETINELFVKEGLKSTIMLDTNATIQVLKSNSNKYSIIHLATHGIINEDEPEFSGLLFYDNKKSDFNNFSKLRVFSIKETYNLQLKTELVVLSSCKSGVGKNIKGDGLYTLYRGLYFAGAKSILFSIWNIGDKFSAKFMSMFYKFILKGNTYISALRKTKLSLLKNNSYSLPIFWSNYIIIGD